MSLSGVIGSLQTGTHTVTRTGAGTLSMGRWTPGSTSSFAITAVVVPVTAKDLIQLPESFHGRSGYRVTTTTELKRQDASQGVGDLISIDGVNHTVMHSETWRAFGQTWYVATCLAEPL